jgi:hypothetical protein
MAERERGLDLGEVIVLYPTWDRRLICYALDDNGLFLRLVELPIRALATWCKLRPYTAQQNLLIAREDWIEHVWVGRPHERQLPGWRARRRALRNAMRAARPMIYDP